MSNKLNIAQIQEIIPHRHPFLLVDCIEDYVPGEYAIGYKNVTFDEYFFRGHFPETPRDCRTLFRCRQQRQIDLAWRNLVRAQEEAHLRLEHAVLIADALRGAGRA